MLSVLGMPVPSSSDSNVLCPMGYALFQIGKMEI